MIAPSSPLNIPPTRLTSRGLVFPFAVAPMVGLSHAAFRRLIRRYTPKGLDGLVFTEMLSTRRLPSDKLGSVHELRTFPNETHFVPQILGNEESFIAKSLEKLHQINPWGIDINMGCPVEHTLKHNWGVRLLGDKAFAAQVVGMCVRNTSLPVSVKLRAGTDAEADLNWLLSFTEALEKAGAHLITIHARTQAQKHKGEARWDLVGQVQRERSIPVLANGNIQCAADACAILQQYGADGAMIARAATARPWIFWQIAEDLGCHSAPPGREGEKAPRSPEEEGREYTRAALQFLDDASEIFAGDEAYILEKFIFYVATGSRWLQFGHAFWKMCTKAKTLSEMRERIVDFSEKYENPMALRVNLI